MLKYLTSMATAAVFGKDQVKKLVAAVMESRVSFVHQAFHVNLTPLCADSAKELRNPETLATLTNPVQVPSFVQGVFASHVVYPVLLVSN